MRPISLPCPSLCRLAAVLAAGLTAAFLRAETTTYTVQWREPGPAMPWLAEASVRVFGGDGTVTTRPLPASGGDYPHGLEVTLTTPDFAEKPVWLQLRLAHGYGFTFSIEMLRRRPYLWVRDLGVYLSRAGTWEETAELRAAAAKQIARSTEEPFVSTAEKYFTWTGFTEHEPDDIHRRFWDFIAVKQTWPLEARAIDRIARMPEVDAEYFTARVPDLKYHKMFLGWAEHNDQFTVWETGRLGVSSQSVGGHPVKYPEIPWHPRAGAYTMQFGVGPSDTVRFREPGDDSVRQHLDDGHSLIVTTEWTDADTRVEQTSLACPLDGDETRTGLEPLLAWTRLRLTNLAAEPRDVFLGVRFTDADLVTFMNANPLPHLDQLAWRPGGFYLLGRLVAVTDPALRFEEVPVREGKEFRARVQLAAAAAREFTVANFYRPDSPARAADVARLGFAGARARMLAFWDRFAARSAAITVPEPLFNNLYRTFLPRLLMNVHPDPQGMPVMHTSPIIYSRVWHHLAAIGIAGDLARRGLFAEAERYLEPFFAWQDIPAPDSPAIQDWTGFFGAPPEQCAKVWVSYQGRILWAAARVYELSGDRAWFERKLPALLKGMEWVRKARAQTLHLNPDGSKPLDYGWIPPGRTGDSGEGTSIFTDANMWLGMDAMTRALERYGHPDAARWRAETDEYRVQVQDGQRRAMAERPLVRLNDDTWVPYFPAFFETKGLETGVKYFDVVDGAWAMGVFDTSIFPPGSPESRWLLEQYEDDFTILNPSLPDEPFSVSGLGEYLARDEIPNFLYTFYSQSTNTLARETLTTYEHRSWGQKRVFELTPWAAGTWTTNFATLLCRTVADRELWLLQATPRRWLRDGEEIAVQGLQTEFGPITFRVHSRLAAGEIAARIEPPTRRPAEKLRLRLRVPDGRKLREVTVNGKPSTAFDPAGEWIELPAAGGPLDVVARY
jgi:hypothetical protein